MSDNETKEAKPKRGKGMLIKLVSVLALLGAGGGGTFALVHYGVLGAAEPAKKQRDIPRLIKKGEEDPYAPPAAEGEKEGEAAAEDFEGEGGSEYRTLYYSFRDEFTSNLHDSDALVQVSLAASTRRDGRVIMWIRKHELAIRSELLAVLADTPEADVTTLAGKQALQRRLTAAINRVLTQTEGFGGVDAVYFKSLVVQ